MDIHSLEINPIYRPGSSETQERHSIDFVVNGKSLYAMTNAKQSDLFGRFSKETSDWNQESEKIFLLEMPSDLENGRIMLFVCPECGDIGCGAITMKIERENDTYVWSDFAYENDYDPEMTDYESYTEVGPFFFFEQNYREVLNKAKSV